MTWCKDGRWTQQEVAALSGRDDLKPAKVLTGTGSAFWGPSAAEVVRALQQFNGNRPKISDAGKDDQADAFAQHCTFFVLDPGNPMCGVWGLNAMMIDDVKAAQEVGNPCPDGYYRRLYDGIPGYASLKGLAFQSGFGDAYFGFYPGQRPVVNTPGTTPTTPPPGTPPPGGLRTWEVIGRMNGQIRPLTDCITQTAQGWTLNPGGAVTVGDAQGDGSGVAGTPGQWTQYSGGQAPEAYGLDPGKGVLAMAKGTGGQVRPYPLTGTVLTNIFGAGWRTTIYG